MNRHTFAASLLLMSVTAGPASQSAFAADSAPVATNGTIETIVVTARRREENLQNTPVSISAFSAKDIQQHQFKNLRDIAEQTPNLFIIAQDAAPSGAYIMIRSQRTVDSHITEDPAVGVYTDGIYRGRSHALNLELGDVSRIEVLKGPQGTLFGRNTTGGAIQIISRQPSGEEGGFGEISYGEYNSVDLRGAVEIPISDDFNGRVTGLFKTSDGFAKNLTTGQNLENDNRYLAKATFVWKPTDNFDVMLVADMLHSRENGAMFKIFQLDQTNPVQQFIPGVLAASLATLNLYKQHFRDTLADARSHANTDSWSVGVIAHDDLGSVQLKSISSYQSMQDHLFFDSDGTSSPLSAVQLNNGPYWAISQELQVYGKAFDEKLSWIAGLYYFHEQGLDQTFATLALFGLTPVSFVGYARNNSYAAYSQLDYDISAIPGLSATAGIRFTIDTKELISNNSETLPPPTGTICTLVDSLGNPLNPCVRVNKKTFSDPTWTLGLNYQANDHLLVYFANRRGYRSGGFNTGAIAALKPFLPETITDYELGLKSDFDLGNVPMRADLAAFYADYNNIQRFSIEPAANGALQVVVFNAATATIHGLELELTAAPSTELTLNAGFGASIGKYSKFFADTDGSGVLQDLHLLKFPGPEYQANLSAHYELPHFSADADLSWNSTVYDGQTTLPTNKAYSIVNAQVAWTNIFDSGFEAAVFARNLGNTTYAISSVATALASLGTATDLLGPPRVVGVRVTARFGSDRQ